MPRYPLYADRIANIGGSVFEKFAPKMRTHGENLMRLHIGDTYMHPVYSLPYKESFTEQHNHFNQYCNTFGIAGLRSALAKKLNEDNNLAVSADHLLVTCGGTNALYASVAALVNPGDEVIVLTPAWPFFFGMVQINGGILREIPVYMELFKDASLNIADLLEEHVTSKTVAIYVNSPNNPSGKMLNAEHLRQIATIAVRHNLWVISDEAYDGLTFENKLHVSISSLPVCLHKLLQFLPFLKSSCMQAFA